MTDTETFANFQPAYDALQRRLARAKDRSDYEASDWEALFTALPRFASWWKPRTSHEDFLAYFKETHNALHRCWTKDVGTPGYDKSDWRTIDNTLSRFARDAATEIGIARTAALLQPHLERLL
jgi:hypothetical protein